MIQSPSLKFTTMRKENGHEEVNCVCACVRVHVCVWFKLCMNLNYKLFYEPFPQYLIFAAVCVLLCIVLSSCYRGCPRSSLLPFFSLIDAWWYLSSLRNCLFLLLSFPVSWDLSWVPTVCLWLHAWVGELYTPQILPYVHICVPPVTNSSF